MTRRCQFAAVFVALMLVATFSGCATKPEPVPEPVVVEPAPPVPDDVKALLDQVKDLREKAIWYNMDAFDKTGFEAADVRYNAGTAAVKSADDAWYKDGPAANAAAYDMARRELKAAIDMFKVLRDRGQQMAMEKEVLLNQILAIKKDIEKLKAEIVGLGIDARYPEDYASADARYVAGSARLDTKEYEAAKSEYEASKPLFEDILARGKAAIEVERLAKLEAENKAEREALRALRQEVIGYRTDAVDLGLNESDRAGYAAADSRYVSGSGALDADELPTARTELEAALALFKGLVTTGAERLSAERRADAESARGRALASGSAQLMPGSLALADAALARADALRAGGNAVDAVPAYIQAVIAFDAVEKGSRAAALRDRIDTLGFGMYDAGNHELAGDSLDRIENLLRSDPRAARSAADEALLRYGLVLSRGWEYSAANNRDLAQRTMIEADAIKARVAVKAEYATAEAAWEAAMTAYAAGDHEGAVLLFEEAERLYRLAYDLAAKKRAEAEAALAAAAAGTSSSATMAMEAGTILDTMPAPGEQTDSPESETPDTETPATGTEG